MKIRGSLFVLEAVDGYSPSFDGVNYTDINKTKVFIPMKVLITLYEGARDDIERRQVNWEEFTSAFFGRKQD